MGKLFFEQTALSFIKEGKVINTRDTLAYKMEVRRSKMKKHFSFLQDGVEVLSITRESGSFNRGFIVWTKNETFSVQVDYQNFQEKYQIQGLKGLSCTESMGGHTIERNGKEIGGVTTRGRTYEIWTEEDKDELLLLAFGLILSIVNIQKKLGQLAVLIP
ncbi:hypothetical protein SAMN02745116_00865 [Pilibacter termitis]|uniref:Uncharacterized protein n=1 Tax=Pilibacter termitis TaxID=263852 RepID=A0A1T4LYA2_9ENTE|nr:hypothetical protein [Pilibacter termitis]SJZ59719.1 hypothetical protein SAMN02745116_00865 [Pilibacter termitis]